MDVVKEAPPWHALSLTETARLIQGSKTGLTSWEAEVRLSKDGKNTLPSSPAPPIGQILLHQLESPLILILLIAAALAFLFGDLKDGSLISTIIIINSLVGGFHEWSAERRSHALRRLLLVRALVKRDGFVVETNAETLVVGDAVSLESGQIVPADLRLLQCQGLQIDESLLTGESDSVEKSPHSCLPNSTPLADRVTMVYAGTVVCSGRGIGSVVATGSNTEIGQLAIDLQAIPQSRPPLVVRMDNFSRGIGIFVAFASIGLAWLTIATDQTSVYSAFLFAIAFAVSAIPEGLPVALTVALSVASHRMSDRHVIVRRLPAVEGLGSCTLIASDKTGTLTANRLKVTGITLRDGITLNVETDLELNQFTKEQAKDLNAIAQVSVLCNEAEYTIRDRTILQRGDPTEVALLALASKLGHSRQEQLKLYPEYASIPFEPQRRYAASFNTCTNGRCYIAVKGAPERVIPMCQSTEHDFISIARELASQGLRVLAVAEGETTLDKTKRQYPDEPSGLHFLGLVALQDPLRPEVRSSLLRCSKAGIRVLMITGDHPKTAGTIAQSLGLIEDREDVVTGLELDNLSERQLSRVIANRSVFARVTPDQKLRLVRAAQQAGHFVAVTGDGVNDAPALQAAEIGIAMGIGGTDVAREASDLVLTDDNFSSIVAGIEEGRIAYANVRKVVALLVSTGFGEIVLITLAVANGLPLPLLPVQLLWLNLVTNGIQDLALCFESAEGQVLQRRPRSPKEPVFDRLMRARTLLSAAVIGLVGYAVYAHLLQRGWEVSEARNALLFQMVLFENMHAGNCRFERDSVFSHSPFGSPLLLIGVSAAFCLHVSMMLLPMGSHWISTGPLPWNVAWIELGLSLSILIAVEAHKLKLRRGERERFRASTLQDC